MSKVGTLYIISAPSGAGKTTLVHALLKAVPNIQQSISYTTRPKRANEEEGLHYHFIDKKTFDEMLAQNLFLEHAEVFGNFYGTSKVWLDEKRKSGIDIVLEIDWQGARQIRTQMTDIISIFILPPSYEILRERLIQRHQDENSVIEKRMQQAKEEISHYNEYDFIIYNDKIEEALNDLQCIVIANRLRFVNQRESLSLLVSKLLAE